MEVPKIRGTLFGGPNNKDYSILGSILGSPYFGKLPYIPSFRVLGSCKVFTIHLFVYGGNPAPPCMLYIYYT